MSRSKLNSQRHAIPTTRLHLPLVAAASCALLVGATACDSDVQPTTTTTTTSSTGGSGGAGGAPDTSTVTTASSTVATTGTGIGEPSDMYPAPHGAAPQVINTGGPVLVAPKIVPIVFANDDPTIKAQIEDFTTSIGASEYWKAATSEYGVGAAVGLPKIELAENAPANITDTAIQQFLANKIMNDPTFPEPDGQTLYAVFYPSSTKISLQGETSCQSFGGYHAEFPLGGGAVPYAVVPRCNNFGGLNGIDMVTGAGSHEYVEAVTDPFPYNNPAFSQPDGAHLFWLFAIGGGETGDMCAQNQGAFTKFPDLDYVVQRSWSNASAKAGHDPCLPTQDGHVYFNAVPVLKDTISLGQGFNTKGVKILEGETKTIDVQLFSDGPTGGPFNVTAFDPNGQLDLSFDQDYGQNGQTLHLTITVNQASQYNAEVFYLLSDNGVDQNMWIGLVGN